MHQASHDVTEEKDNDHKAIGGGNKQFFMKRKVYEQG
jgi:hypothetical protein